MKFNGIIIKKINILHEKNKNVVFCSIFGSSQDGNIKHSSDLDIAICFYKNETYEQHAELLSKISTKLDFDNLDFVDLNTTQNYLLAFEAISGNIIYNIDPEYTAGVVSYISRMYEDREAA